jgi:DNA-binding NtrC family response regulator
MESSSKITILLADDDELVRHLLSDILTEEGFETISAIDGHEAVDLLNAEVSVALFDITMPGKTGLECLEFVRKHYPSIESIIITGSSEVSDAVKAMKLGAFDYVLKPIDPDAIVELVKRAVAYRRLKDENRQLRNAIGLPSQPATLIGISDRHRKIMEKIDRVAQLDSTVLITGESGVGKGLVTRMIHSRGPRRSRDLVTVNCATLPRDLVEAELFGHEKGAFTGAHESRPGRVEIADGGSLFLDEIGDMPLELQPKLLAFLQEKIFERIGSNQTRAVNVRVIAATNQNLKKLREEKRFREDLYFRLNVLPIHIPPLRDRKEDIRPLAEQILNRLAVIRNRKPWKMSEEFVSALETYDWPGNVRELENHLERITAFTDQDCLQPDHLPEDFFSGHTLGSRIPASLFGKTLSEIEKEAIIQTLRGCKGNKLRAARVLGISEKSIYNKMKRFGIQGEKKL